MHHAHLLWVFTILLSFFSQSTTSAVGSEPARPNIMVILCDDLGYGDLSCFGHPHIKTPHLDQLAQAGIRFTDCYSAAPVCSASRAGLLTGRIPNRTGVYDWIPEKHPVHLTRQEITIPELLKGVSYDTAHIGKWHLSGFFNSSVQPQPKDHGFDYWFATYNNAAPSHENPNNFVRNGNTVGRSEGFSCQIVAQETLHWLQSRPHPQQPFFTFVCFHEPHEPIQSPADLVQQYLPVAENEDQAQYFANVTNMDRAVGQLLDGLDQMKLTENTLVYFSSDNGPETLKRYVNARRSYGSHGPLRDMKLHVYEGGIRVPGIVRYPAMIKPQQVISTPVCSLDLLPTFCELAGATPPQDRKLDGTSLVPLFKGEALKREHPLFWNYYRAISLPRAAVREGDWKIVGMWDGPFLKDGGKTNYGSNVSRQAIDILKSAQLTEFALYNMKADIAEQHDVKEQYPEVFANMKQKLIERYLDVQEDSPSWPEIK
jgi:arylsulfatase A